MDMLEHVVTTILNHPSHSNKRIALRCGCDRRTVRRYRRLIGELGTDAELLHGCNSKTIGLLFNARSPRYKHEEPAFDALIAQLPGQSERQRWRAYKDQQQSAGKQALSYGQFLRRKQQWGQP